MNSAVFVVIAGLAMAQATLAPKPPADGVGENAAGRPPQSLPDVGDWLRGDRRDPHVGLLEIRNVRLDPAPAIGEFPTVNLRFELISRDSISMRDIVIEVSVVPAGGLLSPHTPETGLAGPFTLRAEVILRPGSTMRYEMRLRNLSIDCGCRARVDVISARPLGAQGT